LDKGKQVIYTTNLTQGSTHYLPLSNPVYALKSMQF
jgi:hypothetical protein